MSRYIFLASVFALLSSSAYAIVDQEKLFCYYGSYMLYFDDDNSNYCHDPQEEYYPYQHGNDYNYDMSCWYASACCLMKYEGYVNPYCNGLKNGCAHSPVMSPWGSECYANGGAYRTFDDGGWQHWAFDFLDIDYQPFIKAEEEFTPDTWTINPLQWCKNRIQEGYGVGVCLYSGFFSRGSLPSGYRPNMPGYYHAITIWEIDEIAGTLLITDSDDQVYGYRIVDFTYFNGQFSIQDLYPGPDAHINYCIALEANQRPVDPLKRKFDAISPDLKTKLGLNIRPLEMRAMDAGICPMMDGLILFVEKRWMRRLCC